MTTHALDTFQGHTLNAVHGAIPSTSTTIPGSVDGAAPSAHDHPQLTYLDLLKELGNYYKYDLEGNSPMGEIKHPLEQNQDERGSY